MQRCVLEMYKHTRKMPPKALGSRLPGPRRFSPQQQQERCAIGQIMEAFHEWNIHQSDHDLGEDLLVQIYDDGRYTGLSFFLQLKSVRDIRAHERKKTPNTITYPEICVKDLLHWIDSVPAVVVLVWDVNQKAGYWEDIPSIVRCLDARQPDWRQRPGKISIKLPKSNRTDEDGRSLLRARLADIALPLLSQGRELELESTFVFDNTSKDRSLLISLQRLIEEGGAIAIPSRNIKAVRFSEWFERAYGRHAVTEITIAPSCESQRLRIGFRATGPNATETIYLDMIKKKGGIKSVTFATTDDKQPLSVVLTFSSDRRSYLRTNLTFEPGRISDIHTALMLARFELALQEYPGVTVLLPGGHELGPIPIATDSLRSDLASLKSKISILQKLSFIQSRVARFGHFDLTGGISSSDLSDIEFLLAICSGAPVNTRMNIIAELVEGAAMIEEEPAGRPLKEHEMFRIHLDQIDDACCLNLRVPLGSCDIIFSDSLDFVKSYNQAVKSGSAEAQLIDAEVTLHFPDWIPPHEGPMQPLVIIGTHENSA